MASTTSRTSGWWGMVCWNGLSAEQQTRLVEVGNLEFGYRPEGDCPNGAAVAIETEHDAAPGPRFYCRACAIDYLSAWSESPIPGKEGTPTPRSTLADSDHAEALTKVSLP